MGELTIFSNEKGITALRWDNSNYEKIILEHNSKEAKHEHLVKAKEELKEYFLGKRKEFTISLDPNGSPFQQKVWKELKKIPYGKTITYKDLATRIGNANASRAVGGANRLNPVGLIIPCHRVIGSSGKLTGFAGGIEIKSRLLRFENGSEYRE